MQCLKGQITDQQITDHDADVRLISKNRMKHGYFKA